MKTGATALDTHKERGERHDWTKPGMSETTRREIERLTSEHEFHARVTKANARITRTRGKHFAKNHLARSTAKRDIAYYAGDAPNFRVTLNGGNGTTEAAVLLLRLGVRPDQITYATEDAEDAA